MKLSYKIALYSVLLALVISFLFSVGSGEKGWFLLIFGLVCLLIGGMLLLVAGILYLAKSKEWSKGMLLGAGILFLVGMGVCGPLLLSM